MDMGKINRIIAAKILGWKSTKWQNHFIDDKGNSVDVRNKFTTDLNYAWLVAEKLYISVTPQEGAPKEMNCHAEINNQPTGNYYEAFGESAPMAICMVALKSIGVDFKSVM